MEKTRKGGKAGRWHKRDVERQAERERLIAQYENERHAFEQRDVETGVSVDVTTGVNTETLDGLINEGRALLQRDVEREVIVGKQLTFTGRGFGRTVAKRFDDSSFVEALVKTAGRYLPKEAIHVDYTTNKELVRSSCVKWSNLTNAPKSLEVYYFKKAVRLPVLAHEVGHLATLKEFKHIMDIFASNANHYQCEVLASRWAVAFLKDSGVTGTVYIEAVKLLQDYLDGYYKELAVPVRYILDEAVTPEKAV
jgi:hypothetical protein